MKVYKTDELNAKIIYKLLSGSVIPRPIAWLTTQNENGVVNAAPFSFFNVVSSSPPLISVSFTDNKDSLNNILQNREAVVHLVNTENVELVNQTAARLSAELSEIDQFSIELEPSKQIRVPSIKNSKIRFETELYKHISLENNGHLVLLRIVNFVIADELIDENFHLNTDRLSPVARLAGNQYAKLGEIFEINRPM